LVWKHTSKQFVLIALTTLYPSNFVMDIDLAPFRRRDTRQETRDKNKIVCSSKAAKTITLGKTETNYS